MNYEKIILDYLRALENSDYGKLMNIFEEGSIVNSPLYGEVKASDFYLDLFENTNKSNISLLNIFNSINNEGTVAGHFIYEWILKNGIHTEFECVDIFKLNEKKKIKELTIIYDTQNTRNQFEKL